MPFYPCPSLRRRRIRLLPSEWRRWNSHIPRCNVVGDPSDDNEETGIFYSSRLFGTQQEDEGRVQRLLSAGDEMNEFLLSHVSPTPLFPCRFRYGQPHHHHLMSSTKSLLSTLPKKRGEGRRGLRIVRITTTTMSRLRGLSGSGRLSTLAKENEST